jgi:hypothetical protein
VEEDTRTATHRRPETRAVRQQHYSLLFSLLLETLSLMMIKNININNNFISSLACGMAV